MKTAVSTDSVLGRIVLMLGHVGGMLDLVVLPLWVGGLIGTYAFSPPEAGGLVTMFLVGVLASNAVLSRRFGRLPNRTIVAAGYGIAAACFFLMTRVSPAAGTGIFSQLAVLHVVAGLGIGAGLSCVHGTIARSRNPHRSFAIANLGVGVFAIAFFAATPPLMAKIGVNAVFLAIVGVLIAGTIAAALAFPEPEHAPPAAQVSSRPLPSGGIGSALVLGFAGVVLWQTAQALTNSFVERIGISDGFALTTIGAMFAINGFVALLAPALAGLTEKKLSPVMVATGALILHGLCSLTLTRTGLFGVYTAAFMLMIFVTIFGHTFVFGLFARLDPTGRMNARTPSMLMLGTAIGPFLGGTVVQAAGFPALGMTSATIALGGAACFFSIGRRAGRVAAPVRQAA